MTGRRIQGDTVDINQKDVRDFFVRRGKTINPRSPVTSVLYQDANPELAIQRDAQEAAKVLGLLTLTGRECVLDVGCGIGRWAGHLGPRVLRGLGIDVSEPLVDYANAQPFHASWTFVVMPAEELSVSGARSLGFAEPFDVVLLSGVCVYLNDHGLARMLRAVTGLTRPGSAIYVREPVARATRLTLKGIWSEDLQDHYSAIYRTAQEYGDVFRRLLDPLRLQHSGPMYDDDCLNNRRETYQHFWLYERN